MSSSASRLTSATFRSAAAVLGDEEILGHYLGVSEWTVIAWIRGAGTPSRAAVARAEQLVADVARSKRLRAARGRAIELLEDAACAVGGRVALAAALQVEGVALLAWLKGREAPGEAALLGALDIVERRDAAGARSVH